MMTLNEEIEKVDQAEKILRNAGHILRTKRIKQKTGATEGSDRQVSLAINILLTILDTDRDWLLTKNERKIINENLGDVNGKEDCQKAIDSLTEDEVKALCWKGGEE